MSIVSMTGYGKATRETAMHRITVEVKSLNGKFFDLKCKLPIVLQDQEMTIRNVIKEYLLRGSINLFVSLDTIGGASNPEVVLNTDLAKSYYKKIWDLGEELGQHSSKLLTDLVKLPEVLKLGEVEADPALAEKVKEACIEALDQLVAFRRQEGIAVAKHFLSCAEHIETQLKQVEKLLPERRTELIERIQNKLSELSIETNPERFEQELIYYLEKIDIAEELQRLKGHLSYFKEVLNSEDDSLGKKLGFISQEMGREINTMGVKANHLEMQKATVQMKEYLEQIKEQVLNVV